MLFMLIIQVCFFKMHCISERIKSLFFFFSLCLFVCFRNTLYVLIICLAPWAGKMNRNSRCDWLPERARWSYLARSGYGLCSARKIYHSFFIVFIIYHSFLSFFFRVFMDLDFVSVHKHAKKELGQYPAILTSRLVNNPYIHDFFILTRTSPKSRVTHYPLTKITRRT